MKVYEPTPPLMTIREIEANNETGYKIIMEIVRHGALLLYHTNPATKKLGLEKCMEAILDAIDTGYAKIVYNEEDDFCYVGWFNSSTGKYQPPAVVGALEEDDWT